MTTTIDRAGEVLFYYGIDIAEYHDQDALDNLKVNNCDELYRIVIHIMTEIRGTISEDIDHDIWDMIHNMRT